MADFTNQGLKYRHLVKSKRLDPWKKWYQVEELELFPGEKVKLKKILKCSKKLYIFVTHIVTLAIISRR